MVNGQRIKELMLAKGMDSTDLAERIGISAPMMSYIIRNLRDTNVTTLVRIAQILEVPVDELVVKEG